MVIISKKKSLANFSLFTSTAHEFERSSLPAASSHIELIRLERLERLSGIWKTIGCISKKFDKQKFDKTETKFKLKSPSEPVQNLKFSGATSRQRSVLRTHGFVYNFNGDVKFTL